MTHSSNFPIKEPLNPTSRLPWESSPQQYQSAFDKPLNDTFSKVRFSLVIPIYNSGNFLEKTLRSIQFNNLENVQLIVSDGGSTDNTADILDYYKEIFDIVISEPDKGQSDAINKGFACATGELLGWLNGDDLLIPYALDFVRSQYLDLQMPDFMVGDAYMVEKDLSLISHKRYSEEKVQFKCLLDWATNHLVQPSVFFSKRAWEEVGPLDINDHYAMDADLFLGLARVYGAKHLKHTGLSYSVYHEECKTRGKQAESITQLALVQCKHGGFEEAKKSLDYLVEIHNKYKDVALLPTVDEAPPTVDEAPPTVDEAPPPANVARTINDLKICIFSTFSNGGAAIAASRSRKSLELNNFIAQSYSLFNPKPTKFHKQVRSKCASNNLEELQENWLNTNIKPVYEDHSCVAREQFSISDSLADISHILELSEFFDILHLHWVSGLIDSYVLDKLPANKPIVWTLHDMHPFTGGCHYSEGCMQFSQDCSGCHLLDDNSSLAHEELNNKIKSIQRLTNVQIITPSLWLKNLAEQSTVFSGKVIHHIPNIMPIDTFKPHDRLVSRIELELPLNKKLLLFGADNITNLRKGGDILQKVAHELKTNFQIGDIEIVFFGNGNLEIPFPSHSLGHISDASRLALVYSAADAFVFPSREDNAPMSVVESMLCGTPVIASNVGNVTELINHKQNGFIAEVDDVFNICQGIKWLINQNDTQSSKIRSACRHVAKSYHNESRIISLLSSVYHKAGQHLLR